MMKKVNLIGYLDKSYPNKRNIINCSEHYRYKQVRSLNDFFKGFFILARKFKISFSWYKMRKYFYLFCDFNLNQHFKQVDLIHFFNTINLGKTPSVISFEGTLPIYHVIDDPKKINISNFKKVDKALKYLASPSCHKIIAISNYAYQLQEELLNQFPERKEAILNKMTMLYPPQKLLIQDLSEKTTPASINFVFAGRNFYRKGGYETVKAFVKLAEHYPDKLPFTLHLVGDLSLSNDETSAYNNRHEDEIRQLIKENEWIKHHTQLENAQLLALFKASQVGLLPTSKDTFGYSVLEMQASGCPVITTDIQALSEINDNRRGWLINMPQTKLRHALNETKAEQLQWSENLQVQLEVVLLNLLNHPEEITEKATRALCYIDEIHSPAKYGQALDQIYQL